MQQLGVFRLLSEALHLDHRMHVACCTGYDGRTHVACCTDSHFLHDFPRSFTHFSFSVKLKTTRTETTTSTMRQTVAFGFMFTYCDAHGIKQLCLLHLRVFFGPRGAGTLWTLLQSVCPVIRNLKQLNSSPTLHFFSQLKEESARQCRQRPAAHRSQQSVETQEKDVARLRKMGNASTRNAYSPSQQKVSSHSHGISKIEGLIVSTFPEPKVKQKRSREPDCHKKEGWVAIGTFATPLPSEKAPILCNTRQNQIK